MRYISFFFLLSPGGSGDLGVWESNHHKVEQGHPGIQGALEIKDRKASAWHLNKHHILSHSFILHHGFDLQAPAGTSSVCVAGNVRSRTDTISYASYWTRLLYMSYCISILVWQCCTVLKPTQPSLLPSPQAALWLADSPEASQCILECIPLCCLHRKVLFFQMFCFTPTCMQQLLGHILWYLKVDFFFFLCKRAVLPYLTM